MKMDTDRRDDEPAAEAQGGGEHGLSRTDPLHPASEDGGGQPEEDDGDRERPAHIRQFPVGRRGLSDAQQLGQGQIECGEGIGLADAKVHRQRGGREQEPVVSGRRNRAFPIEE